MTRLLCFAFCALALFIHSYECAEQEQQIKMITTKTWFYNPIYVKDLVYTVTEGNATYNNVQLYWDVRRNLPSNLKLFSKVYATDKDGENGRLILNDVTAVCEENEKRQFLPKVLIVPEEQLGGRCIKAGVYDLDDMGQLRFEHLVPDVLSEGNYYRVDYRLGTYLQTVLIASFYSKWGYLEE